MTAGSIQREVGMMDEKIRLRADIAGQKFGKLVVTSLNGYVKGKSLIETG